MLQPVRERVPLLPFQDKPEMRHRHIVAVDRIAVCRLASLCRSARCEMRNYLMSVQIEVDPVRIGTSFGTPENAPIKSARGGKIINRECEMKTWHSMHDSPCLIRGVGRV